MREGVSRVGVDFQNSFFEAMKNPRPLVEAVAERLTDVASGMQGFMPGVIVTELKVQAFSEYDVIPLCEDFSILGEAADE